MVIPNNDKKVRNLLLTNEDIANLILSDIKRKNITFLFFQRY